MARKGDSVPLVLRHHPDPRLGGQQRVWQRTTSSSWQHRVLSARTVPLAAVPLRQRAHRVECDLDRPSPGCSRGEDGPAREQRHRCPLPQRPTRTRLLSGTRTKWTRLLLTLQSLPHGGEAQPLACRVSPRTTSTCPSAASGRIATKADSVPGPASLRPEGLTADVEALRRLSGLPDGAPRLHPATSSPHRYRARNNDGDGFHRPDPYGSEAASPVLVAAALDNSRMVAQLARL